jgi:hypothetical protein
MRSTVPNLSDRLAALLAPVPKLDRYDDMAIDISAEASSLSFKEARELIAARLRLLHTQGLEAGVTQAAAEVERAFT